MAEIIIKNSARNANNDIAEHQFVPQYRLLGITPEIKEHSSKEETTTSIPNVGNTEENFWLKSLPEKSGEKESHDLFFLIAKENLIMTGTFSQIQKKLEDIFYQDNNKKYDFTIDDCIVLKKMKIKIGIFVE